MSRNTIIKAKRLRSERTTHSGSPCWQVKVLSGFSLALPYGNERRLRMAGTPAAFIAAVRSVLMNALQYGHRVSQYSSAFAIGK